MIRGYLTFTRKERYGVLFLLILIIILFVIPYFFKPSVGDPDPAAYEKMKEEILKSKTGLADSSPEADTHYRYKAGKSWPLKDYHGNRNKPAHADMFYFDPNRINANDWQRLGLTERLIQTILHYLEKGGRFYKAEDLKKLYGLHNADYERLFPYVHIVKTPEDFQNHTGFYAKSAHNAAAVKKTDSFLRESPLNPGAGFTRKSKKFEITDINQADSAGWSRLPGIGAKLAARIIHFREKLGGFCHLDQPGETFGLQDSTFQKIKPFLRLNTIVLSQIDLNRATRETLQSHPYIRWQIAKGIIDYRQQHGSFHSVDELLQLAQIDQIKFEKIKPYLVVKP